MTAQRRIPLVEDDWLIAADHTDTLEQVGYQVFGPVSSVSAALQMIDGLHIDAAVLDLNLNGQASYPIAELLILNGIRFLFVCGYSVHDLRKEFANARLLPKPIDNNALLSTMGELMKAA